MTERRKPLVIELSPEAAPRPEAAPQPPDTVAGATRPPALTPPPRPHGAPLGKLLFSALAGLAMMALGLWTWEFVAGLKARGSWLGWAALGLAALAAAAALGLALRELLALTRLGRLEATRARAERLAREASLDEVRRFEADLSAFYRGRAELAWALAELERRRQDITDPAEKLAQIERTLLGPLDAQATAEIEAAARRVAAATAVVPLALADVAVALVANLRMIRRIAEIYGGRGGMLGSWRLARAVAAHLVATGAVAVGDDMIGSLAGGGLLAKVSRRFGEGVVNGALTARVGVAAVEVCRPMPFSARERPGVSRLLRRALAGLFPG